jgi:SPP1 gp7 family putative phage head morphogenesis protein
MNVNTKLLDDMTERAALLRRYEDRLIGDVNTLLGEHETRTNDLLLNASPKEQKKALTAELDTSYKELLRSSRKNLIELALDEISFMFQALDASVSRVWRTKRPQNRIAENIVLEQPLYSNMTLAQGWSSVSSAERRRLEQLIRRGIAEGWDAKKLALEVRRGNVHKISRNSSQALTITAMTSVHAQADNQVLRANKDVVEGWQYISVLDSRTSDTCKARDGKIYRLDQTDMLPPAHFRCRSTTTPIIKSWDSLSKLEGVLQVRKRNLEELSPKQKAFYDGQTPMRETYNQWLLRQPIEIQKRHLKTDTRVKLFNEGKLTLDKFILSDGDSASLSEIRQMHDFTAPGDTLKLANAKKKLEMLPLGASRVDDFHNDSTLESNLVSFYELQSRETDGLLSLTNYRGQLIASKKANRDRVINTPPTEKNLVFNPVTGRYEDNRRYLPNPQLLINKLKLVDESPDLKQLDRDLIKRIDQALVNKMSSNERAVVVDNLRTNFERQRRTGEPWSSFKGASIAQMKYDVLNASEFIENQLRKDTNLLVKLKQDTYIDPVLGAVQLDDLHNNLVDNIRKRNLWEDSKAPKIARKLRGFMDLQIPIKIRSRLGESEIKQFYLKFAHRLALADSPDVDQLAVGLGRDLHNLANYNGNRREWHQLGMKLLESNNSLFKLETFGVQKRRMKSRMSGSYFGPYYDTLAYNVRITDPVIQEYSKLQRKVDVGMRVPSISGEERLVVRPGYKTYFLKGKLGYEDTRIPLTSTGSFSEFPVTAIDQNMADALNWAGKSRYKIDKDFYDFTSKLLNFRDDKGQASKYEELNEFKHYISERGDAYERFKTMEWLREKDAAFNNVPFLDHRARIYERGFIGPQSGETFRPFLNTAVEKNFSPKAFKNFQDQIGAFLGGLSTEFEGPYNSLSVTGRQKIAAKWRNDLVSIGNKAIRAKPQDIRDILNHPAVHMIEGEELGKFFRLSMEFAKLDNYLDSDYSKSNLERLKDYKTALALEQDASSSGAQIIAITTRNKKLAELSNVVPTMQKQRLYDEIARLTFNDPRFKKMNERLGLTEIDLRKAAKA